MLRTILAATATAIASFAGVAVAADAGYAVPVPGPTSAPGPSLTGDLSLAIGAVMYGGSAQYGVLSTLGRVNVPLHGTWNLEVEAGGSAIFEGGDSQPSYIDAVAHLWGMHSPTAAWGVFGGAVFGFPVVSWAGGVEAKHFLPNGSFGASAAVWTCSYCDTSGAFTVSYNHYFNPNHRIGVRAAILTDFTYSIWEVSADVEHRFAHPISLFADATYVGSSGGPGNFWVAKGGVKFYLDAPADTLQSHETKVPWTMWVPAYFSILMP